MTADLVSLAQKRLLELADPAKAGPMQAYMKTDMPFYGGPVRPAQKDSQRVETALSPG